MLAMDGRQSIHPQCTNIERAERRRQLGRVEDAGVDRVFRYMAASSSSTSSAPPI
ncbi:MAG: hypothetical protein HND48_05475 [Chloroflexi bacterium]|nr:hypothetical protein [Chloroflexota bacterium]